MKLATMADGTRLGRLHVISRDGTRGLPSGQVTTLQDALECWSEVLAELEGLAKRVDAGEGIALDPAQMLAPLPRAVQWLDGSAFETHARLLQEAWGRPVTGLPERPLMYQGLSDRFLAPGEPAVFPSADDGIDFEGEFGVILGDVPMGTKAHQASDHIRLIVLINDWSLRALGPIEMATGFGWLQCKPACAIAPLAITPEELGYAWKDSRVCLPLSVFRNGIEFGRANGGEMRFGFDELIEHAAYSRDLPAGTILGSGTVANADFATVGSSCIAERRAIEQIDGTEQTAFLTEGETVGMAVRHPDRGDLFGPLSQCVAILSNVARFE